MEEENKPLLENATFQFSQEGNCADGGCEFLEIRCESSLGIDRDKGCFFTHQLPMVYHPCLLIVLN